jgi:hypothetical protein
MQVHRTGRYYASAGVQFPGSPRVYASANHRHAPVFDANVGAEAGKACAVDYGSTANYQIKLGHAVTS